MQIIVSKGRTTVYLNMEPTDTIARVMELISERLDIPIERQRLRLNNLILDRTHTLAHYNIESGTTIRLISLPVPSSVVRNTCVALKFKKRQKRIRRKKFRVKTVIRRRVIH